jgi:hypothetical protein
MNLLAVLTLLSVALAQGETTHLDDPAARANDWGMTLEML